ncbi:hypothetical protein M434DRAFT_33237 [Hypoxylon sp. CO27-5]|nr:hypothetical protein M434DRAFT_33237 [Hypoxylon sp. CO27-5]
MAADNPLDIAVIITIVLGTLILVIIVSFCLVRFHRASHLKNDRVNELRQLEKDVASAVSKKTRSGTATSATWGGKVQQWQNKHENAEPGTACSILLSPRSKSQANKSHTSSGNESTSRDKGITADDETIEVLFSVGSADDDNDDGSNGEVHTPTVTDAKAVPIINPHTSRKPVAISIVGGKIVEESSSLSSHQDNSGQDPTDSQNSKTWETK